MKYENLLHHFPHTQTQAGFFLCLAWNGEPRKIHIIGLWFECLSRTRWRLMLGFVSLDMIYWEAAVWKATGWRGQVMNLKVTSLDIKKTKTWWNMCLVYVHPEGKLPKAQLDWMTMSDQTSGPATPVSILWQWPVPDAPMEGARSFLVYNYGVISSEGKCLPNSNQVMVDLWPGAWESILYPLYKSSNRTLNIFIMHINAWSSFQQGASKS